MFFFSHGKLLKYQRVNLGIEIPYPISIQSPEKVLNTSISNQFKSYPEHFLSSLDQGAHRVSPRPGPVRSWDIGRASAPTEAGMASTPPTVGRVDPRSLLLDPPQNPFNQVLS